MQKPMTEITYWTQPYPQSIGDARANAAELRGGYDPHAGTFSNDLSPHDPLSMEAIRATVRELDQIAPRHTPEYGYVLPPYLQINRSAWDMFEAEIERCRELVRGTWPGVTLGSEYRK